MANYVLLPMQLAEAERALRAAARAQVRAEPGTKAARTAATRVKNARARLAQLHDTSEQSYQKNNDQDNDKDGDKIHG